MMTNGVLSTYPNKVHSDSIGRSTEAAICIILMGILRVLCTIAMKIKE